MWKAIIISAALMIMSIISKAEDYGNYITLESRVINENLPFVTPEVTMPEIYTPSFDKKVDRFITFKASSITKEDVTLKISAIESVTLFNSKYLDGSNFWGVEINIGQLIKTAEFKTEKEANEFHDKLIKLWKAQ